MIVSHPNSVVSAVTAKPVIQVTSSALSLFEFDQDSSAGDEGALVKG